LSIIYEALKKVEKNITAEGFKPSEITAQAKKPATRVNPALIYILVITLGFFCGNLLFKLLPSGAPKPAPAVTAQSKPAPLPARTAPAVVPAPAAQKGAAAAPVEEKQPAAAPAEAPAEKTEPSSEFILNGVFFSGNGTYALINNRIVRKGDEIEGAAVKKLDINGVVLEFRGKTIELLNNIR
jgi:nucleoid-associated protein YgaU